MYRHNKSMVNVKQHHVLQLFDAPAEVPVVVQERLNARQEAAVFSSRKEVKN